MRALARWAVRLLTGAAVLAMSPVLGLAGLAGTAMLTGDPDVFTVVGLAVFASVFFLGLLLCVPRPRVTWGRWTRALVILGIEVAVVWQVTGATLRPPPDGLSPLPPVAGQREWRLPTGSRLAYVRLAPKRVTRPDPVVVLHGGPGLADLKGDSAFFGGLTADGYPVYVYDQLGAGHSERLADPHGYGLSRDVADLDAIRQTIGAERLTLIGHGYGAQLAAAYLAAHRDRVSKVVFSSPAALDRTPSTATLLSPSRNVLSPRVLAAYTLLRVDPRAAHAFAGDPELDAHLDRLRQEAGTGPCPAASPSARTDPTRTGAPLQSPSGARQAGKVALGSGGYANLAQRLPPPGLRQDLAGLAVPALVVKGSCDGQSWSAALGYRRALPATRLVYLEGDPHRDSPGPYLQTLRAFLTDRPLTTYDGDDPPPGHTDPG
ncbi:alpha/beta hydrolase [Nonomuraea sp. NPDC000554]|uniref:alpha/beta hydrolase n=1 Tax=Nonomuraea sp. NPDC000554 TaxID=3154259 RepID=UPI00331EB25D